MTLRAKQELKTVEANGVMTMNVGKHFFCRFEGEKCVQKVNFSIFLKDYLVLLLKTKISTFQGWTGDHLGEAAVLLIYCHFLHSYQ